MNKYQNALDKIVENSCPKRTNCRICNMSSVCNSLMKDEVDILQELINKGAPKKVKRHKVVFPDTGRYFTKFYTPCCNTFLDDDYIGKVDELKYCPKCGQALDWEEETL